LKESSDAEALIAVGIWFQICGARPIYIYRHCWTSRLFCRWCTYMERFAFKATGLMPSFLYPGLTL